MIHNYIRDVVINDTLIYQITDYIYLSHTTKYFVLLNGCIVKWSLEHLGYIFLIFKQIHELLIFKIFILEYFYKKF